MLSTCLLFTVTPNRAGYFIFSERLAPDVFTVILKGRILAPLRNEFPDFIPVLITSGQIQSQLAMLAG